MGVGKRLVNLVRANLSALLEPLTGDARVEELTDEELELELERRRARRRREDEARRAREQAERAAREQAARRQAATVGHGAAQQPNGAAQQGNGAAQQGNGAAQQRRGASQQAASGAARQGHAGSQQARGASQQARGASQQARGASQQARGASQQGRGASSQRPSSPPTAQQHLAPFYALLETPVGADLDTVKRNFRRLMRTHHPDVNAATPAAQRAATERSQRLTAAYAELEKHLQSRR